VLGETLYTGDGWSSGWFAGIAQVGKPHIPDFRVRTRFAAGY
jgi:hypothetical protein